MSWAAIIALQAVAPACAGGRRSVQGAWRMIGRRWQGELWGARRQAAGLRTGSMQLRKTASVELNGEGIARGHLVGAAAGHAHGPLARAARDSTEGGAPWRRAGMQQGREQIREPARWSAAVASALRAAAPYARAPCMLPAGRPPYDERSAEAQRGLLCSGRAPRAHVTP